MWRLHVPQTPGSYSICHAAATRTVSRRTGIDTICFCMSSYHATGEDVAYSPARKWLPTYAVVASSAMADAPPPPLQMPATPNRLPRRRSAAISVTRIRAPEQPNGWPRATAPATHRTHTHTQHTSTRYALSAKVGMHQLQGTNAPPLTLTMSPDKPRSLVFANPTTANASFSSHRSTLSADQPARASAWTTMAAAREAPHST